MNDQNLTPFSQMDEERHKELSRRGGIASGDTRRRQAEEKHLKLERSIAFLKKYNSLLCDAQTEADFRAFIRQRRRKQRK